MFDIGGPEFLFMAESEGLVDVVDTRTSKINAVINHINAKYYCLPTTDEIIEIAKQYGINDLTYSEKCYIKSCI